MAQKQNILLTGASGTVGFEVLKRLYQHQDEFNITVFDVKSKKSKQRFKHFKSNIEYLYGDISNFDDIRSACSNKDFVIHLAAIIPPIADQVPELAFQVNVKGTENLIKNLEELSPNAFLLYSSSISVYGNRLENPLINCHDPLLPSEGDEYAKTKIEAENCIIQSKLDWSIFRLTAIMGSHKISALMFHMPLNTSLEIATPQDTARAFVNALYNKNQLSKKIYNLGGGQAYRTTYKEFLTRSFRAMGLGNLDFPDKSFAEKNYHCGFYEDGDLLNEILHFRTGTIDDYFREAKKHSPHCRILMIAMLKKTIKKVLLKKSEPYHAFWRNDTEKKKRFFNG